MCDVFYDEGTELLQDLERVMISRCHAHLGEKRIQLT